MNIFLCAAFERVHCLPAKNRALDIKKGGSRNSLRIYERENPLAVSVKHDRSCSSEAVARNNGGTHNN